MARSPENPYLVAVNAFRERLTRAKKFYEFTRGVDLDWDELAGMMHVTRSVMSEIKLGKRPPRLAEGVRLATILGVRPEWLLLDSGAMTEEAGGATASAQPYQPHTPNDGTIIEQSPPLKPTPLGGERVPDHHRKRRGA